MLLHCLLVTLQWLGQVSVKLKFPKEHWLQAALWCAMGVAVETQLLACRVSVQMPLQHAPLSLLMCLAVTWLWALLWQHRWLEECCPLLNLHA
jgi:hypothetical protein